ncbi:MAG: DAK2 domain-containing protein [Mycoplasmoidaceae bacterium]
MNKINTEIFLKMFENGSKKIEENFEYINELNIFPVPDGDTGTNMLLTSKNTYKQLKSREYTSLNEFAKFFSRTLLMNARGNSGVIFTQIFRGFFSPIIAEPEKNEISLSDLVLCFQKAKESAYSSVVNPIEGTILTIIRVISEWLDTNGNKFDNIGELFDEILLVGNETLEKTPDMLPQLKEAELVDSGAYGLMLFFEGMSNTFNNFTEKQINNLGDSINKSTKTNVSGATKKIKYIDNVQRQEINEEGFGYCCEFICQINYKLYADQTEKLKFNSEMFEKELLLIGDSLVKILDGNLIKVHLHTFWPYKFLEIGQKYGEFLKIKVDNMTQQYLDNHPEETIDQIFNKNKLSNKIKILVTAPSKKIGKFFRKEFGISDFINTEVTGNPSIIDFTNKIHSLQTKNILIIIDDVNFTLPAEQVLKLQADRYNIVLIKAKNPLQVLAALFVYNNELNLLKNKKLMEKSIDSSRTGAISISVKSLKTNGITVYKDNYIAIINKDIIYSSSDLIDTVKKLIKKLSSWKRGGTVNIIYGKDATMNQILIIEKYVNEKLNMKCKIIEGKQSIYHYYISI